MRALIVGGGIGGMAAAVALIRRGIEVRVYEQAPRLAEVGAGVVLAPNSLRLLDRLGLGAGGADGIHSVRRGHVAEPAAPPFSGVIAHRGVIGVPPGFDAGTMRMWLGEGKHFLAFGVRAGQLLNFVGFVSSGDRLRESWSAPGDQAALAAAFSGWDPVVTTIIDAVGGAGFRWGLYDRAPLRRWSDGRLTLLGDAAHPMLPHLGQGANQAIEDAAALATLLGAVDPPGVSQALAAYQALRLDRTARVQLGSRLNGAGYDASGTRLQSRGWIYDYDAEAAAAPVAAALRGA